MEEVESGVLGFVEDKFDEEIKGSNARVEHNL